jgi:hypothetical protein
MTFIEISEVLGNLGEFGGALAVVGTLLYLAVQVRQSGKAAMFSAVQASRTQRVAFFAGARDSPYVTSIYAKEQSNQPLNEEEEYRLACHWAAFWGMIYAEWVQKELGSAGEYATKDDSTLAFVLASPSSREFFGQSATGVFPEKFVTYINSKMPEVE